MSLTKPEFKKIPTPEDVAAIALSAGQLIMAVYEKGTGDFALKADNSPLTEADLLSHRFIMEQLNGVSQWPVLSEEEPVEFSARRGWERFWLVDPLDGTKDFIARDGEFTVNIALIEKEEPVLGVIGVPAQGIVYFAAQGRGAFRRGPQGTTPITCQPGPGALRCADSRFHTSAAVKDFCRRYGIESVEGFGSALKFCRLAEGAVDVYPRFGPTMEWDIAAGHCLLKEAGGYLRALATGAEMRYNQESLRNSGFVAYRQGLDFNSLFSQDGNGG